MNSDVSALFAARGEEIASIITEPLLCNSGSLMPAEGFLPGQAASNQAEDQ